MGLIRRETPHSEVVLTLNPDPWRFLKIQTTAAHDQLDLSAPASRLVSLSENVSPF